MIRGGGHQYAFTWRRVTAGLVLSALSAVTSLPLIVLVGLAVTVILAGVMEYAQARLVAMLFAVCAVVLLCSIPWLALLPCAPPTSRSVVASGVGLLLGVAPSIGIGLWYGQEILSFHEAHAIWMMALVVTVIDAPNLGLATFFAGLLVGTPMALGQAYLLRTHVACWWIWALSCGVGWGVGWIALPGLTVATWIVVLEGLFPAMFPAVSLL